MFLKLPVAPSFSIHTTRVLHYVTRDKGETWTAFDTDLPPMLDSKGVLSFHAHRPDYVIFMGKKCVDSRGRSTCDGEAYYTKDSFQTSQRLLSSTQECIWGHASPRFDNPPTDTVYCTEWPDGGRSGNVMRNPADLRLVRSETFFKNDNKDIISLNGGAVGIGMVEKFMVVAVAYTILESSEFSLSVDILATPVSATNSPPFGTLYLSNSNGTYFTKSLEHTNRDRNGKVDFERVQAPMFEGILFANVVDNWKDLLNSGGQWDVESQKRLTTMMSFDNGARWRYLRPPARDSDGRSWSCTPPSSGETSSNCAIHLHSITHPHNVGRVFTSSSAAGFVLGVGNVGKYLLPYDESDTFLSTDGGLTWSEVAKGPHKYETADMGSLVILVPDKGATDHILYSSNLGSSFTRYDLKVENSNWVARMTMIDPDSTSQKMIVFVTSDSDSRKHYMVQVDFENLHQRKCDMNSNDPGRNDDFELWNPREKVDGPNCLMGRETGYYRRKKDAQCYVGKKFKQPEMQIKHCTCEDVDYECDYNFIQDPKKDPLKELACIPANDFVTDQPYDCKPGQQYDGKSGYRKIPGNSCTDGSHPRDAPVKKDCKVLTLPPSPGDSNNGRTVEPPEGRDPTVTAKEVGDMIGSLIYVPKSDVVLMKTDRTGEIFRSTNQGKTWDQPEFVKSKGIVVLLGAHDAADKRAYMFFNTEQIWYTDDALASESGFKELKQPPEKFNTLEYPILDFHPEEPDYLVFVAGGRECGDPKKCFSIAYTSTDHGRNWNQLDTWVTKCLWVWDTGFKPDVPKDAVYCSGHKFKGGDSAGQDRTDPKQNPVQLVLYKNGGRDRTVLIDGGVLNFYVVNGVLVAATQDADDKLKLMVSVDGSTFAEAVFPPYLRVEQNAFTLLESTTGGLFMDILQSKIDGAPYGDLFVSNANGTFYTRSLSNTNRNAQGQVDFEKMQGVDGIILANQVLNTAQLASGAKKSIRSMMSFDDGSTWNHIKAPTTDAFGNRIDCGDSCYLNLHCHADLQHHHSGQLSSFHSTSAAVGLMIGVGNVGPSLLEYETVGNNMYITRDGGRTWTEIRKGTYKWAIGDHGGIIVLVKDRKPTDTLYYSWDFGAHWAEYRFTTTPVLVTSVLTESSSTSRSFIILGMYEGSASGSGVKAFVAHVDFTDLFKRQCVFDKNDKDKNDFEPWSPTEAGGNRCFLGQEVKYWRRQPQALCYVGLQYKDLPKDEKVCECTERDFECDFNFWRDPTSNDPNTCNLYGPDPAQPDNCKTGSSYEGSSGYRKIPLSKCKGGKEADMLKKKERKCNDFVSRQGDVFASAYFFDNEIEEYFYFNQTSTLVVRDGDGGVWWSKDEGMSWEKLIPETTPVAALLQDPYRGDRAFFLTNTNELWLSSEKGHKVKKLIVPRLASPTLKLHPDESDWMLLTGLTGKCDVVSDDCHMETHYSKDGGVNWHQLNSYTSLCMWAYDSAFDPKKASLSAPMVGNDGKGGTPVPPARPTSKVPNNYREIILCQAYDEKKGNQRNMRKDKLTLVKSSDWGRNWETVFKNTVGFAIFEEYMVVAMLHPETKEVKLHVSMDAMEWAEAIFPQNFKIPEYGYTVLESSTGSIFLDAYVHKVVGAEWGTLFRSNYNGTYYTLAVENTNRDRNGYVDFEKMQGIPGIAMVNQVINTDDLVNGGGHGKRKKVQTLITYNDGAKWDHLKPPTRGVNGRRYECNPGSKDCNLHLHSYTERSDPRDQFSSSSAVGLMMGVGNVGSYLADYTDGNTFITRDAGRTWVEVTEEAHMFEFGDHGAILLLMNDEIPTDHILYTLDQGMTIRKLRFTDYTKGAKVRVSHIVTEPEGTTSHFVMFGQVMDGPTLSRKTVALHLDFSKVWSRKCEMRDNEEESDFEKWSPGGGDSNDACMFGKKVQYYRRKRDRQCRIDSVYEAPKVVSESCECTAEDFECDYNYMRVNGSCVLMPGAVAPYTQCENGQYQFSTGYRKLKKSSCKGGLELDQGTKLSCGGGIGVFSWLMIGAGSLGLAGLAMWGFQNYPKWTSRGGRIRLPADDYELAGQARYADSWAERVGGYLRQGLVLGVGYLIEAGEWSLGTARTLYDWGAGRLRHRDGYAPVDTNEREVPELNDASLLDLDDY
ncbi:vacuolar protein sorting/targeting protein PEP1 [Quaeritorhiza haematococci]|nr:vacuolar protein sorting/targeting protein PEP1 [Quaeritorhiza haematococci]